MVGVSANQMQSNGYRLNVGENSKYLLFESEDYCKKLYFLARVSFVLINFCNLNEDKQDEIYVCMLALQKFLENLPILKIKVGDDKFDFDNEDIDNFDDPFGIEFPTIEYYFRTIHFKHPSDFDLFHNTLKSDEVKEKFRVLYAAVDDVLYSEYDNQ